MDFEELLQFLQETSNRISKLIHGLADSELRWRNCYDQFSVLENICHLRDIEAEAYSIRINRILKESNPFLPDVDGKRLATERRYNSLDADVALHSFAASRTENLRKLEGLVAEQLERAGTLEGVGRLTLGRLAEMMREHDEGHIEELRMLRQQLKQHHPT
ncbi:MAG: DinB family protein [Acidobacteriota bacterium]|nr:DinB family protein [Acidobacteriota bacterium]